MTPTQRAAAERLIVRLDTAPAPLRDPDLNDEAAALLRELLAEPVQEPAQKKPSTASQFESVKQAKRAAEYELRYYTKMMKEKNAAEPQGEPVAWCSFLTPSGKIAYFDGKPMVMPGAVGNEVHRTPLYAHPPQQRKPLSDEQIADIVSSFDGTPDWNLHDFARAIERAHGIGEQE